MDSNNIMQLLIILLGTLSLLALIIFVVVGFTLYSLTKRIKRTTKHADQGVQLLKNQLIKRMGLLGILRLILKKI